jgi:CRP/FNR family transcriptional regulator
VSVRAADLRRVPVFATLDDATLGSLARCLRWRPVRVADALYRQGDPGDSMAFVLEGELVARVHLDHGGELEIETIPVGGIVGEMVCFEPALRSATVAAAVPSVVAELGRDALVGLRLGAPEVYARLVRRVITVVAARLRQVNDRIDAELEDEALRIGAPLTTELPAPVAARASERPLRASTRPLVGAPPRASERPRAPGTLPPPAWASPPARASTAPAPRVPTPTAPAHRAPTPTAPASSERTSSGQGFARLLDRLMRRPR